MPTVHAVRQLRPDMPNTSRPEMGPACAAQRRYVWPGSTAWGTRYWDGVSSGGREMSGFPISHSSPNGSTTLPTNQPCSSSTGDLPVAATLPPALGQGIEGSKDPVNRLLRRADRGIVRQRRICSHTEINDVYSPSLLLGTCAWGVVARIEPAGVGRRQHTVGFGTFRPRSSCGVDRRRQVS